MSIEVICPCGAKLKASSELVGKQVKCPTCHGSMTVPVQLAPSDKIRVSCACGATFKAKPSLAGKKIACPKCSQPLSIPTASTPSSAAAASPAAVPTPSNPAAGPAHSQVPAEDPLGLDSIGFDISSLPPVPRPEPVVAEAQPAGIGGNSNAGRESSSGGRRRNPNALNPLDMVAGGFAVLHGVIAGVGVIRLLIRLPDMISVLGVRAIANFSMFWVLASTVLSACILTAGVGVLTNRKKWALTFGNPASIVYLVLVGLSMLNMIRVAIMLRKIEALGLTDMSEGLSRMFLGLIPRMIVSAIGPVMLVYLSVKSQRRR